MAAQERERINRFQDGDDFGEIYSENYYDWRMRMEEEADAALEKREMEDVAMVLGTEAALASLKHKFETRRMCKRCIFGLAKRVRQRLLLASKVIKQHIADNNKALRLRAERDTFRALIKFEDLIVQMSRQEHAYADEIWAPEKVRREEDAFEPVDLYPLIDENRQAEESFFQMIPGVSGDARKLAFMKQKVSRFWEEIGQNWLNACVFQTPSILIRQNTRRYLHYFDVGMM